jgi:sulfane dehydrogenase subunit SoxC
MEHISHSNYLKPVAGNGLLHRRLFLTNSVAILGAAGLNHMTARQASAAPPDVPKSMTVPGAGMSGYGARSRHEDQVERTIGSVPGTVGTGASRTPIEHLEGIITPNALHFERHHNGVPDIDPTEHRLMIHGLVDRPLIFDLDSLSRYPFVSSSALVIAVPTMRPNRRN